MTIQRRIENAAHADLQPDRRGRIRDVFYAERAALRIPRKGDPGADGAFTDAAIERAIEILLKKTPLIEPENIARRKNQRYQRIYKERKKGGEKE